MDIRPIFIRNGIVVNPKNGFTGRMDVCLLNGIIKSVKERLNDDDMEKILKDNGFSMSDADIIDACGRYVMPGFIDLHVHLRDPGQEYKEDIETGGMAAAHGGVTTICAMPNTNPVVDNIETLRYVQDKAKRLSPVNVLQISAITKNQDNKCLVDMQDMFEKGAAAFSEDGKSVMDINLYMEAMKKAADLGAVVMAHCEEKNLVGKGVLNEGAASEKYGVPGITNAVEDIIAARDIFMAGATGARLHLCHCSTEASVELVRMAKKLSYNVTAEVCPHHFTLTDEDIKDVDANYKMNPPLRTEKDVKALIKGLCDGTMDCISTDHAPHSAEEKEGDFITSPFGITGLETSASLTYTALVDTGLMSISDMASKMSHNPAKVLGIDDKKGSIEEGMAADICIFDSGALYEVKECDMYSRSHNSPYIGKVLKGKVITTICGGKIVYNAEEMKS